MTPISAPTAMVDRPMPRHPHVAPLRRALHVLDRDEVGDPHGEFITGVEYGFDQHDLRVSAVLNLGHGEPEPPVAPILTLDPSANDTSAD